MSSQPGAGLHYIMYVSSARRKFGAPELAELLTRAREKNSRIGVTGLLLYKAGLFLQVLEGESNRVRELYDRIASDERHRACSVVLEGTLPERRFSDWSMAFRNLDDPELTKLPGYSAFMENPRLFADIKV
ncbi:MAG: BLUF domain-containing protein, partial [Opitutaceae bacterium]